MTPAPVRFVSPGMRTLAIVLWVVAVALIPLGLVTGRSGALLFVVAPSVFTAFFAWAVLWRPRIVATAEALVIVDVRRTSSIAWQRVEEIRTRYGLEVVTNEGVRRTWSAPTGRTRLRDGSGERLELPAAADRLRAFLPARAEADGPPPVTVTAAPISQHVHGWTIVALIVVGILASMSGARL